MPLYLLLAGLGLREVNRLHEHAAVIGHQRITN